MDTPEFQVKGFIKLFGIIFLGWVFFSLISPRIVDNFPALKHYGEVQEEYGVHSGRMYYTDLETSQQIQISLHSKLNHSN